MPLILALFLLPLLEIAGFVVIGHWLGLAGTLAVVLLSGVIGIGIVRSQGLLALRRMQAALQRSEPPVRPMVDGVLILLIGALFMVPGFVTDLAALILLFPPVRRAAADLVLRHLRQGGLAQDGSPRDGGPHQPPGGDGRTIEGEFHEVRPVGEEPPAIDSRWGRS
ncbi:MAG TPA: FxsA family protein [Stellaceae bacterium]|nr:FxsA family protein [Stellaceae bacterium]